MGSPLPGSYALEYIIVLSLRNFIQQTNLSIRLQERFYNFLFKIYYQ